MMNIRAFTSVIAMVFGLLLIVSHSQAGEKDFGQYQVNWSVYPSTFLTPEVAKANNLQRSKSIGVVNISIMTDNEHGEPSPVGGQVEGQVANDIQQIKFLAFRRIQEGDSVYFIAQYQYPSGGLMTFNITARPTGHPQDLKVRFAHTLFND